MYNDSSSERVWEQGAEENILILETGVTLLGFFFLLLREPKSNFGENVIKTSPITHTFILQPDWICLYVHLQLKPG
jgi:hypothetical protein